jgi:hypothetical protein
MQHSQAGYAIGCHMPRRAQLTNTPPGATLSYICALHSPPFLCTEATNLDRQAVEPAARYKDIHQPLTQSIFSLGSCWPTRWRCSKPDCSSSLQETREHETEHSLWHDVNLEVNKSKGDSCKVNVFQAVTAKDQRYKAAQKVVTSSNKPSSHNIPFIPTYLSIQRSLSTNPLLFSTKHIFFRYNPHFTAFYPFGFSSLRPQLKLDELGELATWQDEEYHTLGLASGPPRHSAALSGTFHPPWTTPEGAALR